MKLPSYYIENLYNIREILRNSNHTSEAGCVDKVVSQYEGLIIREKINILEMLVTLFSSKTMEQLFVDELENVAWVNKLVEVNEQTKKQLAFAQHNINLVQLPNELLFEDKKLNFFNNVIDFERYDDLYVLLFKGENGEYFDDNLACYDSFGHVMWSSKEKLDVINRRGACFAAIEKVNDKLLGAFTWVGIKYTFKAKSGIVVDKLITK